MAGFGLQMVCARKGRFYVNAVVGIITFNFGLFQEHKSDCDDDQNNDQNGDHYFGKTSFE